MTSTVYVDVFLDIYIYFIIIIIIIIIILGGGVGGWNSVQFRR